MLAWKGFLIFKVAEDVFQEKVELKCQIVPQ